MELLASFLKFSISQTLKMSSRTLIKILKTPHKWTKRERFRGDSGIPVCCYDFVSKTRCQLFWEKILQPGENIVSWSAHTQSNEI